ncbi:hypothetical protein L0244_09110 [bacterium]|nr:hypothetical protein [bacterium]
MQTATLKEATEKLGVSLNDMVHFHTWGDKAIIQIDLNLSQPNLSDNSKPAKPQELLTPEEEFRQKYPNIKIEPEFFKLVGSITVPAGVSDKDLLIDAIEAKY